MTKFEFVEAVANGVMNDEIMAKAAELRDGFMASNAKKTEKNDEAYALFLEIFEEAMTDKPQTAGDLLPLFKGMVTPSGKEPSVQFVSSLAKKLLNNEKIAKVSVKTKGKSPKIGYTMPNIVVDGTV